MNKNVKTIIWLTVSVILILVLIWGIFSKGNLFNPVTMGSRNNENAVKATEFKTDAAGIKNINLEFVSEDIEVIFTNEESIRLEQTSDYELNEKDMMMCSVNTDTLLAKSGLASEGFNFFSGWFNKLNYNRIKLQVFVPKSYRDWLKVTTISGSINLQEGTLSEMRAYSTSGSILIKNTVSDQLVIDSISGAVYVNGGEYRRITINTISGATRVDVQSVLQIKADAVSGAIFIASKTMPDEIKADGVSGSVALQLPENEGFILNHSSLSGGLVNDFEMKNNVYKNGNSEIEIGTISGATDIIKQ